MKRNNNPHTIQTALVLILFCLFLISILFVLISGVKSYSSISDKLSSRYESRTCINYISSKIKHNDSMGSIEIKKFHGKDALYIYEKIQGEIYNTVIYCHDGYLKEFISEKDKKQSLDSGQSIALLKDIKFERVKDNLIRVVCIDNRNDKKDIYISLKSEVGGMN